MKLWHLGNTTVRSPFRLREGLIALSNSGLQGNLRGKENEKAFGNLLNENNVVQLSSTGDITYSIGRKWRSALTKLGFLYPQMPKRSGIAQEAIGIPDTITPNGRRLIAANTVPAMQECFLRSLSAHYISSFTVENFNSTPFSPLRLTLCVMLELEKQTGTSELKFMEMALVVQLSTGDDDLEHIVERVLDFRQRRDASPNKRRFDGQELKSASKAFRYEESTFRDYADTNFRYLKATGLVQSKGRGLAIVPEKHLFIEKIVISSSIPSSIQEYYETLSKGSKLPTDNKEEALSVLEDLVAQTKARGIFFDTKGKRKKTPADIAILRHKAEELLFEANEVEYAARQSGEHEEISRYMGLLINRTNRKTTLSNGDEISIPQAEAPAYFEWVLWRAFLAINSLVNQPYQARGFKIDQDFLPVGTAPGGGPDLTFEFSDFVLVVEVTLTANSRQEAAEGESVRRHVADILIKHKEESGKPVYGLFLANSIDSNTAETFRIGCWYTKGDEKLKLEIVPITLTQFKRFFDGLYTSNNVDVEHVLELFKQCNELRDNYDAPEWKQKIDSMVTNVTQRLAQHDS